MASFLVIALAVIIPVVAFFAVRYAKTHTKAQVEAAVKSDVGTILKEVAPKDPTPPTV